MKILVTGASGFLGKYLVDLLVAAHGPKSVATVGFEAPRTDVAFFPLNLEDEGKTRAIVEQIAPDAIYHLAGVSRVSAETPFEEYFSRNTLTTVHLVQGVASLGKPVSFFFASSVHVYGNTDEVASELTPPKPESAYGFSKYLAEQFLREAVTKNPSLRVVVGRLYSCIGPGQARGFVASDMCGKIVAAMKAPSEKIRTGPLSPYRRFQDVRDVVRILPQLMEAPGSAFEIYNVASPHELQIRQLLDILLKEAKITRPIESEEVSGTNQFLGLKVDTTKLTRLVAASSFRPAAESLRDMLHWELSRQT